jgi:hypothetical protein
MFFVVTPEVVNWKTGIDEWTESKAALLLRHLCIGKARSLH